MVGKNAMTEEDDEVDSLDVFNQQCEDVYLDSLEPNFAKEQCEQTVRYHKPVLTFSCYINTL